jgi:methyl-accepting chemotaxis protein
VNALQEAEAAILFWEHRLKEAIEGTKAVQTMVHTDIEKAEKELLDASEAIVASLQQSFAQLELEAEHKSEATARLLLIVSVITSVLAATLAVVLTRGTIRPIRSLMTIFDKVGGGDLTQRMHTRGNDEFAQLGSSFNTLITNMHEAINSVSCATVEVAAASTEIAASAEEMARSIDEQTRQIGQVSAAVTEMSASIGEVAEKATQTAIQADESGKAAIEGGQVVTQAVGDMNEIDATVTESARVVGELGRKSEKISEIIGVINDIADQTNLLALNAAIEAARAGEHGRGFAVVADEVRKLAERTTGATKEVADSINGIRRETELAVQQISAGTARVKQGVERANAAGTSMQAIESKSSIVARLVGEIAAASEEQASATDQISRSVESVNTATSEASCGANQAATAAAQLSAKSEELKSLVERFTI